MSTITPFRVLENPVAIRENDLLAEKPARSERLRLHYAEHQASYITVTLLALLTMVSTSWNLSGYPIWFTDEGTYMAQAWSVLYEGELSHYTYWYDHPPAGWVQIAIWLASFGGLHRETGQLIMAGREFMVVCRMATAVLMYVLLRRVNVRRSFSAVAVIIFVVSPLSMEYGRYVLLDNISMPWLIAAYILALSPQRRMVACIFSAVCADMAFLSKETSGLMIVPLMMLFWWHSRSASNKWVARLFFYAILASSLFFYGLYAATKGELLPGPGHVSLIGSFDWQLFERQKNGSILDPSSDAFALARSWYLKDPALIIAGLAVMFPAMLSRKLWPLALALLIQVLVMMRNGYLPYPHIIGLIPFMAMLIAAMADRMLTSWQTFRGGSWHVRSLAILGVVEVLTLIILAGVHVMPGWQQADRYILSADATLYQRQAVSWVNNNVPRNARLVTEGAYWLDFRTQGFTQVIWREKLDTDPEVMQELGSADTIQYIVVAPQSLEAKSLAEIPTFGTAVQASVPIVSFGEGYDKVIIMRKRTEVPLPAPLQ